MSESKAIATFRAGPDSARLNRSENIPQPGSWWRIIPYDLPEAPTARDDALKKITDEIFSKKWDIGQSLPDHGLILLLIDARYIDGDIHSLVLAPHPGWEYGRDIKLTLADFGMIAQYAPDGLALREAEKSAMMSHMQRLQSDVGTPPDPEDVGQRVAVRLAREEEKAAGLSLPSPESDKDASFESYSRKVPAALLPSQDIVSAEKILKTHIATAEVTREIIEERISKASQAMKVVARFQEEVVATALAGISKQKQEADKLLTSVHTMKLWLGDGIEIHPMTEGQGAGQDEPVHFMQSLLYLDEEIHCAEVMEGGFNADDLSDLSTFLTRHQDIVEAMLPHPRCVAIARVRRSEREFEAPKTITDVLNIAESIHADKTILILTRDGANVSVIEADQQTSGAKRLFPSREEIDAIFRENRFSRHDPGRVIDVTDVQYAEKRADHDKVALFYKRFLLILWGAHERAEIFGSLPKGMNWLKGETHDQFFRFIHDEEFGLDDTSRKSVKEWRLGHLRMMRPGSRAVLRWNSLITPSSAPGAFNNPEHRDQEQIRAPLQAREIVTVQEAEGALVATCACEKPYDWRNEGKTFNVSVQLAEHAGHPEKSDPRQAQGRGIFVIDHMTSREVESYLGSRKARRSYMAWIPEIKMALPEIRKREAMEAALLNRILVSTPEARTLDQNDLKSCIHEAVLESGWKIPDRSQDIRIVDQARRISQVPEDLLAGANSLVVRAGGLLVRSRPLRPLFEGMIDEPFLVQEVLEEKKKGWVVKSSKDIPDWMLVRPGDVPVHLETRGDIHGATPSFRIPSLKDRSWMMDILDADISPLLENLISPSEESARHWVDQMIHLNQTSSGKSVIRMPSAPVIGFAVIPPRQLGREPHDVAHSLRAIRLSMDIVQHAYTAGYQNEALRFGRIHANPSKLKKRLEENRDKPALGVFLDRPTRGKTWRSLEKDMTQSGVFAGFKDLTLRSWHNSGETTFTFDQPDLKTALLRAMLQSRAPTMMATSRLDREAWLEDQKDIRVFLPDNVEEKLLKIISIYEELPGSRPEAEMAP